MRKALREAGVEFTNDKGPGVRLYAPDRKPHPRTPLGTPGAPGEVAESMLDAPLPRSS